MSPQHPIHKKPKIGLILGSGSARGWSHIGVIQALEEAGIKPDIICGTSIGALVGAAYAAGEIDVFTKWVLDLKIGNVLSFMDVHLNGGFLKGEKIMNFFKDHFMDRNIEDLNLPFGSVATSLTTGNEIWIREGSTVDAVRASLALPGLFTPFIRDQEILVDGGLVNPVPVSLARAMGADFLIAVDLNSDLIGRYFYNPPAPAFSFGNNVPEWLRKLQQNFGKPANLQEGTPLPLKTPSLLDVIASSVNIMQAQITRSRMAGEPPHIIIAPQLAHLSLLDFHRAAEAIEEGRRAVEICLPALDKLKKHKKL
ncbi:patatin-like phospholipase RssA [Advenella sp. RU8]|uniref:patatin-like phospholipase RssA n=1 Tax=Advenella sp. RU8 TaxID=3399575 RepID=UPI003AAF79EF